MRILLLFLLCFSPIALASQTSSPEPRELQALVKEVHDLRQDLRTITVASQRVQIVLYRLQAQEGAVNRATQHLSDQRSSLINAQDRVKETNAEIQGLEDRQSHTQNPVERKNIDDILPQMRVRLESLKKDQQQFETNVSEAESQLRREQQELTRLQGFLDQLDSVLNGMAQAPERP